MGKEFGVSALALELRSELDAYLLLEDLRWGADGPDSCPKCGAAGRQYFLNPANGGPRKTRTGALTERRVWKCGHCRRQYSVLTGTIFSGTKISIRTWLLVIIEVCSAQDTVSASQISRQHGITNESGRHLINRIREAMTATTTTTPATTAPATTATTATTTAAGATTKRPPAETPSGWPEMAHSRRNGEQVDPKLFVGALVRISPAAAESARERSPATRARKPPEGPTYDYGDELSTQ